MQYFMIGVMIVEVIWVAAGSFMLVWIKVSRNVCNKNTFYCTTIAYHVELNADLGWPQASGQRRRKIDIYSWP